MTTTAALQVTTPTGPERAEMGMGGIYNEISRPERLVSTEEYPGDAVDTMVLTERHGKTTCTVTVRYATKEARDGVLQSGMETGIAEGYDKLDELLASQVKK